jgi:hypothetical protein
LPKATGLEGWSSRRRFEAPGASFEALASQEAPQDEEWLGVTQLGKSATRSLHNSQSPSCPEVSRGVRFCARLNLFSSLSVLFCNSATQSLRRSSLAKLVGKGGLRRKAKRRQPHRQGDHGRRPGYGGRDASDGRPRSSRARLASISSMILPSRFSSSSFQASEGLAPFVALDQARPFQPAFGRGFEMGGSKGASSPPRLMSRGSGQT